MTLNICSSRNVTRSYRRLQPGIPGPDEHSEVRFPVILFWPEARGHWAGTILQFFRLAVLANPNAADNILEPLLAWGVVRLSFSWNSAFLLWQRSESPPFLPLTRNRGPCCVSLGPLCCFRGTPSLLPDLRHLIITGSP